MYVFQAAIGAYMTGKHRRRIRRYGRMSCDAFNRKKRVFTRE